MENSALTNAVDNWHRLARNNESHIYTEKMMTELHSDVYANRFLKRLEFGTAGLRGPMGAGFACMNEVTVMQAAQGLCKYIEERYGDEKSKGVVVGFDGRHNSERFAHVTAAVFISRGFKVYLNSLVTATPMTPYTVVKYGCLGGVQCTASHNPKNDNGWKVYARNGAQINSPMDSDITKLINSNLSWWPGVYELLDMEKGVLKDLKATVDPYTAIFESYMQDITKELCSSKSITSSSDLKIVYTPMHGVGNLFVRRILKEFGFPEKNLFVVKEQEHPDPEFSTVAFPNPEEKGAMDLSLSLAKQHGATLVLANDPDADRTAAAEMLPNGEWHQFSGDEIGSILGHNAIMSAVKRGIPKEKMVCLASVVSSRMLEKICQVEGVKYEDALTGFKWIMNSALTVMEKEKLTPVMAYEEALGYGLSMSVPDKDGVSGIAVFAELACKLHQEGLTVVSYLTELRKQYGHFVSNNGYFICHDKEAINALFEEFHNNGEYRWTIGKYKVVRIRDCFNNFDSGTTDKKPKLPSSAPSHMVTLFFENGAVLTLRTSGTEPKIKWYSEMGGEDATEVRIILAEIVNTFTDVVLQPGKYPLLPSV